MAISISSSRADLRGKTMLARALAAVLYDLTGSQVLVVRLSSDSARGAGGSAGAWRRRRFGPSSRVSYRRRVHAGGDGAIGAGSRTTTPSAAPILFRGLPSASHSSFSTSTRNRAGLVEAIDLFSDVHIEIADAAQLPSPGSVGKEDEALPGGQPVQPDVGPPCRSATVNHSYCHAMSG